MFGNGSERSPAPCGRAEGSARRLEHYRAEAPLGQPLRLRVSLTPPAPPQTSMQSKQQARGLATAVSEVASNQSACSASSSWSCCSGVVSCLLRVMAFEVRRQPKGGDRCWGQTGFVQKAPYLEEASEAKTLEGGSAETFAHWRGRVRALLPKAGLT